MEREPSLPQSRYMLFLVPPSLSDSLVAVCPGPRSPSPSPTLSAVSPPLFCAVPPEHSAVRLGSVVWCYCSFGAITQGLVYYLSLVDVWFALSSPPPISLSLPPLSLFSTLHRTLSPSAWHLYATPHVISPSLPSPSPSLSLSLSSLPHCVPSPDPQHD